MSQPVLTDITLAPDTVHNPREPRHFMRIKPVDAHVRIRRGGDVLAESGTAMRVLEIGRDFYEPVLYIPADDIGAPLGRSAAPSTHCPIKGDAVYFDLLDAAGTAVVEAIAWAYPDPVAGAEALAGRVAFDAAHVTIEQSPA